MWLAAFAFAGTILFLLAALSLAAIATLRRKSSLARRAALGAGAVVGLYVLVLLASSVVSSKQEIRIGAEKHICEIDCHLAYTVLSTARHDDEFVVALRVRFDPQTISSRRGNALLVPGRRSMALIDADGRQYSTVRTAGLQTALRPGESAEATLRFMIPVAVEPVYLRFEDADPTKMLLIGSETALLHKSVLFRIR